MEVQQAFSCGPQSKKNATDIGYIHNVFVNVLCSVFTAGGRNQWRIVMSVLLAHISHHYDSFFGMQMVLALMKSSLT